MNALTKRKILVVDDNADAANSFALLLKMHGNDVRVAHDGEAAVSVAESFRPEIVLMDLGMPKMNGLDAAKTIRGNDWGQPMTLVALTGWGQDENRRQSKDAGFDHHLTKPVDLDALAKLIS